MDNLRLLLIRDVFTATATCGKLFSALNDDDWSSVGYTLEPVARAGGVKLHGTTCIPPYLQYTVTLTHSARFGRIMPLISSTPDGGVIALHGCRWIGIRFHGGNRVADTSGCVLVARNRLSDSRIVGSQERALTSLIQRAGGTATLEILANNYTDRG